ncbi:riboflavin kinase/FAD synthetase [Spiroplasma sp. TIUS-1]|uniref:riboflavin kinase n=1 Tax=Spiroplasma sp. TIUS-1 TaxID=216963 RepID=UPI00139713A0|nr:riboflavin kinase [Spiroplasma sp. TIUS-1]QHX35918.1 riboflavin kinase/FAD synthetase [Spiroplasma sp. TIUS-1]
MKKINVTQFSPLTKIMLWREESVIAVGDWFNWSDQEDSLVKQLIKTAKSKKKKSVIFVPIISEDMTGFLVDQNLIQKASKYKVDEIFFYFLHQVIRLDSKSIADNLNSFLKINNIIMTKNFQLEHVFNEQWLSEFQPNKFTFVNTPSGENYIKKVNDSLSKSDFKRFKKLTKVEFLISGRVAKGSQRARTLGYPTANLKYSNKLPLKYGVYGAEVYVSHTDETFNGYAFYNSINDGESFVFETHLENFNREIYEWKIIVKPTIFVRNSIPYTTDDEMKRLIKEDVKFIKNFIKGE